MSVQDDAKAMLVRMGLESDQTAAAHAAELSEAADWGGAMTEAEHSADWAGRQTPAADLTLARRPQGRAGHLTHEEKQQIRLEYLEHGGRITRKALAAQFGVNRDTVAECLKGKEFQQLQEQFEQELRSTALSRLKAHVLPAADAWCNAVDMAAEKGDHKPAKDLLMHTGVIEPLDDRRGQGITVTVGGGGTINIGLVASPLTQDKHSLTGDVGSE